MVLAGAWGFAEATLFFIVPDVWLTLIAVRRGIRPALRACLFALAGALAGGAVMFGLGVADLDAGRGVLDRIPAISPAMIAAVGEALAAQGVGALFVGPLAGIPYKIYAVEAAAAGIGAATFLAASIPARLARFVLLVLVAGGLSRALERRLSRRATTGLLLAVWSVFYAVYLTVVPG